MTKLQNLYTSYISQKLTKAQFLTEVNKYPEYRQHYSNANSFEDILKILKRKQLIFENISMLPQQSTQIAPLNFNKSPEREIHVVKCELPSNVQFIHNDTLRQIDGEYIQSFIDATYDGNTDDKDDLEIVTDLLLHHKDELEKFDSVGEKSLDELDDMKKISQKTVKIHQDLNEELTQDHVSTHEFNIGFNIENDKCKDSIKASKKVLQNLSTNSKYYTDLISNHKEKLNLRPQKVKDDTMVDKLNPMIKVKNKAINESKLSNIIKEEISKYLKSRPKLLKK